MDGKNKSATAWMSIIAVAVLLAFCSLLFIIGDASTSFEITASPAASASPHQTQSQIDLIISANCISIDIFLENAKLYGLKTTPVVISQSGSVYKYGFPDSPAGGTDLLISVGQTGLAESFTLTARLAPKPEKPEEESLILMDLYQHEIELYNSYLSWLEDTFIALSQAFCIKSRLSYAGALTMWHIASETIDDQKRRDSAHGAFIMEAYSDISDYCNIITISIFVSQD
jgi:hypothetical protein